MNNIKKILMLVMVSLSVAAFANGNKESKDIAQVTAEAKKAKYVFLFIGDGMAMPQLSAAEAYLSALEGEEASFKKLAMSNFPAQGLTTTQASNALITDSAAAGTAIATGYKTESGVISMDPSKTKTLKTIAELAKESGKKVGIVSSVNLDHATPATFYAHNVSRNNYYDINIQMANSNFDYFGGGMVRIDKTPEGEKTAHDIMTEKGWNIASSRDDFANLKANGQNYAYNTGFAGNALAYSMDMKKDDITLAEFTKKGIELLDNDKGFFMMVEGGKVDWACHANDAAASINNTIAFDNSLKEAIKFYNTHPNETLIVVTGDHETGGLTLGFAGTKYGSDFTQLAKQKLSTEGFENFVYKPFLDEKGSDATFLDILPLIEENYGLTKLSEYELSQLERAFAQSLLPKEQRDTTDESYLLYGGYDPLTITVTHLLNQRAGVSWTSYSHTGVPVPTFAMGIQQNSFNGYYDNTEIFTKLYTAMGI
ncbi:alkaline phosphatase [Thiospirochaeta perfilievii]|uniref:Alkaline phosphatase n=1 Tax=Thiospirochaeta perfilievii TaxID=252967 RepID=A0A5C1QB35_9SPIO|nr:alkaline phosphatase [Thiospirochaeta perfilievii]QEN05333.1 alkaline phosphatase [Thiospirochaeta perfilievii]